MPQIQLALGLFLVFMFLLILWLVWPTLQTALVTLSQGLAPALGALALAFCAISMLGGRPTAALGLAT